MAVKKKRKQKQTERIVGIGAIALGLIGFIVFMQLGEAGRILGIFWFCVLGFSGIAVLAKDYSDRRENSLRNLQDELKPIYKNLIKDLPPRPAGSRFVEIEGEMTADLWRREKVLHFITSWGYLQPTLIDDSKKLFQPKKTASDYVFYRHDVPLESVKSCGVIDGKTILEYNDLEGQPQKLVMEEDAHAILVEMVPEYFRA